jgi:hypothetical protein
MSYILGNYSSSWVADRRHFPGKYNFIYTSTTPQAVEVSNISFILLLFLCWLLGEWWPCVKISKSEHDRAGPPVGVSFGEFAFRLFTCTRRIGNTNHNSFFYTLIFSKWTLPNRWRIIPNTDYPREQRSFEYLSHENTDRTTISQPRIIQSWSSTHY